MLLLDELLLLAVLDARELAALELAALDAAEDATLLDVSEL